MSILNTFKDSDSNEGYINLVHSTT